MPNPERRTCVVCGKHTSEVGPLSWNGYCLKDGKALLEENIDGIAAKRGPAYRRQLRGMARYVERALLDAAPVARHSDG